MSTSAKKRKLKGENESGSESSCARGSSLSSEVEVETEDKFVRVTDQAKTLKIPLLEDGTLEFSSLEHAIPGAYGLKYPTPNSNVKRGVPFNDNKKAFEAPFGGWKGKLFEVIYRRKPPVVGVAPEYLDEVERFALNSSWLPSSVNGPLLGDVKKYCFFIKIDNLTTCVTRIHKSYFATFRHIEHKKINWGNELLIYSDDGSHFLATVVYINDYWDFILFKADTDVKGDGPPISHSVRAGDEISLYGRGNDGSILGPKKGSLHSSKQFFGENDVYAKFLVGTIQTNDGDSGGAVFDSKGLLAMNVGRTFFPDHPQSIATNKAAYFNPFNFMVLASSMISVVDV